MRYALMLEENAARKRAIDTGILLAGNILAAVLTHLRSFLDDLRTKGTFPGKKSLMNLGDRILDFFLENLVSEFDILDGLNGLQFTDIANHFRSF